MSAQQPVELNHLTALIEKKRSEYEKMLNANKEFEEVKVLFNEIRQLEKALENGPAPQPWVDSELRGEAPSFTGNRKEFVAKLPQTILHPKYGECQLAVLDDSQHRKSVCYINDHNVKVGHRFGNTWTNLYKEMMIFLGEKGS